MGQRMEKTDRENEASRELGKLRIKRDAENAAVHWYVRALR